MPSATETQAPNAQLGTYAGSGCQHAQACWVPPRRAFRVSDQRIRELGPARLASPLGAMRHLDQRADDAQAGQTQVLERPRLADGVQERIQEHGDVCCACNTPVSASMYVHTAVGTKPGHGHAARGQAHEHTHQRADSL